MRVGELCWLGSHSLLIYLYHMFYAWIICVVTGFSLKYQAPVTTGVLVKSLLLTIACLGLFTLGYIIADWIATRKA